MKKITLLAALLAFSGVSFADGSGPIANGQIKTTDCGLLNENAQINLTASVTGGYFCDTNGIALATCHTAGRTSKREGQKTDCGADGKTLCVDAKGNPVMETKSGAAFPYATTGKGTVTSDYPNTTCTGDNAASVASNKKYVP